MKVIQQVGVERFSSVHTGFTLMLRGDRKKIEDDTVAEHLLGLTFSDALNNEHMIFEDVTEEAALADSDKEVKAKPMVGKTQRRTRKES